jgi:hypothetical protein
MDTGMDMGKGMDMAAWPHGRVGMVELGIYL